MPLSDENHALRMAAGGLMHPMNAARMLCKSYAFDREDAKKIIKSSQVISAFKEGYIDQDRAEDDLRFIWGKPCHSKPETESSAQPTTKTDPPQAAWELCE